MPADGPRNMVLPWAGNTNLAIFLFVSCLRTESGRARGGADTGKTKMRPSTLISVNDLVFLTVLVLDGKEEAVEDP